VPDFFFRKTVHKKPDEETLLIFMRLNSNTNKNLDKNIFLQ
jgi:hypothetical protein